MVTTRKRSSTTRRRSSSSVSGSALDILLGGIAKNTGTGRFTRRRKGTLSSITGSKAAAGSLLLTLAVICFAVGYYLQDQGLYWLTYAGVGFGVAYLLVTWFKNRKKKNQSTPTNQNSQSTPTNQNSQSTPTNQNSQSSPTADNSVFHLSASQRAQITDRLHTLPELNPLHPKLVDAAKVVVHTHCASAGQLMSTLKLDDATAAALLQQLQLIGMIGVASTDGQHSVYVTDETELAEWLTLIYEA